MHVHHSVFSARPTCVLQFSKLGDKKQQKCMCGWMKCGCVSAWGGRAGWGTSHLRLDGVEGGEGGVQRLKARVSQRGDGERLQVEQLRGRGVLLGQDEVPEADGKHRLAVQPAVGHNLRTGIVLSVCWTLIADNTLSDLHVTIQQA